MGKIGNLRPFNQIPYLVRYNYIQIADGVLSPTVLGSALITAYSQLKINVHKASKLVLLEKELRLVETGAKDRKLVFDKFLNYFKTRFLKLQKLSLSYIAVFKKNYTVTVPPAVQS